MKIGDKVVMNDNYDVADRNKGVLFTVSSSPKMICGTLSVMLKDYDSCYAVDGLKVVK